jgi:Tfp pilus assembly protein PilX
MMNRSIDFAAGMIALPFCIALTMVLIATLIAAAILHSARFTGRLGRRLLDEAQAFRSGNPRGNPRKRNTR